MAPEKLGPFQIGRILGRGGMGAVYEGTHEIDGSTVAVKVLSDFLNEDVDTEVRLRFETEIETLKRLHHPNIVRLSGFGEEQGQLYYVMEFVNGSSLQQELRKKRLFQWHEVAMIGLAICQALRHAHDRGVIHRDIKPANILLDQEGNVKLSDFGIARFFGSQQITDVHSVIGTLEYMSPEQALAHPISSSTDLYSLGCVLYVLLTGKPPFSARSLPEILRKHKSTTPDPIRSVRHDVPDDLTYLIVDLLKIQPEDRPRNALLGAKRLQALLQALVGPPETIKVLPMSPDTPKQHHESVHPPSSSDFRWSGSDQQVQEDQDKVVDSNGVVKPERGAALLTPQNESLADSFKRIGEEYSTPESQTSPDSGEPNGHKRANVQTVTARSSSIWESQLDIATEQFFSSESNDAIMVQPPVALRHGEVLLSNTQTLRPAKDEPLPDAAYWSESPLIKTNDSVPREKLPTKQATQQKKTDQNIPRESISESSGQSPADMESNAADSHWDTPPVKTPSVSTRFVAVETKDFDPFEEEHRIIRPIFSLPMVLTSTMLMIVGLTVYYLLQDPSPEVLYDRIVATIKADESSSEYSLTLLRTAQKNIEQFLSLYDDHPSAEQVRYYQDELDLLEHERRLERRAQFSALHSLSPVERAYAEILTSLPNDSEQLIDKLRAFIAVFQPADPSPEASAKQPRLASNPVVICVELARRRLQKLEQIVEEINAEQEQVIRRRLDEAADWDSKDPVRADAIRRGIIELYQNHRWAKKLVEEAKQQLKESGDR